MVIDAVKDLSLEELEGRLADVAFALKKLRRDSTLAGSVCGDRPADRSGTEPGLPK